MMNFETNIYEKYWGLLKENPNDFHSWTCLLQYVENKKNIIECKKVFELFFEKYPYCFGYWKRYADLFISINDNKTTLTIYENAIKAIPLSIDLWFDYIEFAFKYYELNKNKEDIIRKIFNEALRCTGLDFKSDKLWEMYIDWEENIVNNSRNVFKLYDKLLKIPTYGYIQNYENFKNFLKKQKDIKSILDDSFLKDITAKFYKSILPKIDANESKTYENNDKSITIIIKSVINNIIDNIELDTLINNNGTNKYSSDLNNYIRIYIFDYIDKLHKLNEDEVNKRWQYENQIKRPYFHVKELEKEQITNWIDYLDFEATQLNHKRIKFLFERCLIACALYQDVWIKYAHYMEKYVYENNNNENNKIYIINEIRSIYERACLVHCQNQIQINLEWVSFEERINNKEFAWQLINKLETMYTNNPLIAIKRISLTRRQGKHEEVIGLFQHYINNAGSQHISSFFAIKFARFLFKTVNDYEKAENVLYTAINKDKDNEKLYLQLIDMAYQISSIDQNKLVLVFDYIIKRSQLNFQSKLKFSKYRVDYLEECGNDPKLLLEAYDDHQYILKKMPSRTNDLCISYDYDDSSKNNVMDSTDVNGNSKKLKYFHTSFSSPNLNQPQYQQSPSNMYNNNNNNDFFYNSYKYTNTIKQDQRPIIKNDLNFDITYNGYHNSKNN